MSATLPSMALAAEGGGRVVMDPSATRRQQALSKLLHIDVKLTGDTTFRHLGERVYVRIDHEEEPLAKQIYRSARQVFLKNFDL